MGINGPFFCEKSSSIQPDMLRSGSLVSWGRRDSGFIQGGVQTFTPTFRESARQLCGSMVNPDQQQRITPAAALEHTWFQEVGLKIVAPPAGGTAPSEFTGAVSNRSNSKASCCT